MAAVATVVPTGIPMADGILSGLKWGVSSFTFSFPTDGSVYGAGYGDGEPNTGFESFNSAQQAAVRSIFVSYSAIANVAFTEIPETSFQHADLRFAESDLPSTAWAYFPTTQAEGGDAWFNNSKGYYDNPIKGGYGYMTMLHEIGHSLGLKHPHEAEGSFGPMPTGYDSLEFTVMSYRSYVGGSTSSGYTNETWGYPQSLMMADIAALQTMYGANFSTNAQNTTYSWSPTSGEMFVNGVGQGAPGGNQIFLTVWDGGGVDTYDFSNYSTNLVVSLHPGGWSTLSPEQLAQLHYDGSRLAVGNVANALQYKGDPRSLIENAIGGSGNDVITGNSGSNLLSGGSGNDRLTGGGGSDTLHGGSGSDTIVFSGAQSQYRISTLSDGSIQVADLRAGGDGTDVTTGVELFQFSDRVYTATELPNTVPSVVSNGIIVEGDAGHNVLSGGAGDDTLYGLAGDDLLVAGGGHDRLEAGPGRDRLNGQAGDDHLIGGDDRNYLFGVEGNDLLFGEGGSDLLFGDYGNDSMDGGVGDDYLHGGDGADTLNGGLGNDTLIGSLGQDRLLGGDGIDRMNGREGSDTLYGNAGSDRIFDIGGGDDALFGGADGDVLGGGDGNDSLYGEDGDDLFLLDHGNDNILGGAGDDLLVGALSGDDTFTGGSGVDSAHVIGSSSAYTVQNTAAGLVVLNSAGDSLLLVGVERLSFDDGVWV